MTLQELSQYQNLLEKLERNKEIVESLRAAAEPGALLLSGMPRAPGVKDRVGDLAVEIADLEERIRDLQKEVDIEKNKLNDFIRGVDDDRLRTILRLKFIRGLTYATVAELLGERYSEDTIKRLIYRVVDPAPPDVSPYVPL